MAMKDKRKENRKFYQYVVYVVTLKDDLIRLLLQRSSIKLNEYQAIYIERDE